MSFTLLIAGASFAHALIPDKTRPIATLDGDHRYDTIMIHTIEPITQPPPLVQHIQPPADPAPARIRTQQFTPPVIAPDYIVTTPQQQVDPNAQPGIHTQDGSDIGMVDGTIDGHGLDRPEVLDVPKPQLPATWVQQMPEFDGNLNAYLSQHLQYPGTARENNISGRVAIRFVVNEDGSITDIAVMKGIGGGCDEEAIRVIKSMPRWKPGRQNGKAVKVYFTLPVLFQLD